MDTKRHVDVPVLRHLVCLLDLFENDDVLLQRSLLRMQIVQRALHPLGIVLDLRLQTRLGVMHQMPMMLPLHAPLKAQRNQQPNRDRHQVK